MTKLRRINACLRSIHKMVEQITFQTTHHSPLRVGLGARNLADLFLSLSCLMSCHLGQQSYLKSKVCILSAILVGRSRSYVTTIDRINIHIWYCNTPLLSMWNLQPCLTCYRAHIIKVTILIMCHGFIWYLICISTIQWCKNAVVKKLNISTYITVHKLSRVSFTNLD